MHYGIINHWNWQCHYICNSYDILVWNYLVNSAHLFGIIGMTAWMMSWKKYSNIRYILNFTCLCKRLLYCFGCCCFFTFHWCGIFNVGEMYEEWKWIKWMSFELGSSIWRENFMCCKSFRFRSIEHFLCIIWNGLCRGTKVSNRVIGLNKSPLKLLIKVKKMA